MADKSVRLDRSMSTPSSEEKDPALAMSCIAQLISLHKRAQAYENSNTNFTCVKLALLIVSAFSFGNTVSFGIYCYLARDYAQKLIISR